MNIVLVHHADAVGPGVDPQRPLSRLGLAQAEWLAKQAHERGVKPAAIWHSGKLRARQTAEAFWRTCNPFASFRLVRGLRPEDPPVWMRDLLAVEEQDVLLVGHMPHLPELLRELTGSDAFPAHGLVWLERREDGTFEEKWQAVSPADPITG
jgi:phosphohistidine phosphatase